MGAHFPLWPLRVTDHKVSMTAGRRRISEAINRNAVLKIAISHAGEAEVGNGVLSDNLSVNIF